MTVINIVEMGKDVSPNFQLKNINLKVEKGTIFALLGPNGAGKTTLVKLILDLLKKDRGDIFINEKSHLDHNARKGIVFLPEKFTFYPYYTVYGALEFFGKMRGVSVFDLPSHIAFAAKELKIDEFLNRKLSTLSKGQVQRVGLAQLLIGENELIILDEPFSGLDPLGMKDLKDVMRNLKANGKTIFINSHILSEMELLCDCIGIMHGGELKVVSTILEIKKDYESLEAFFTKIVTE